MFSFWYGTTNHKFVKKISFGPNLKLVLKNFDQAEQFPNFQYWDNVYQIRMAEDIAQHLTINCTQGNNFSKCYQKHRNTTMYTKLTEKKQKMGFNK